MSGLRPMLAALVKPTDLALLRYPLIVQPKYDGIRCLITEEGAVSRKLKHIQNKYIQSLLCTSRGLVGLDGELIAGETYNKTSSAVMSRDGTPPFTYYVFDAWNLTVRYAERFLQVAQVLEVTKYFCIKLTPSTAAFSPSEVMEVFTRLQDESHYDGVILRDPDGRYKFGRSTLREQYLLKYKQFDDAEATVIGFECMMHNDNPEEKDNLGYTKRSHKQEGKTASEYLGALKVRDTLSGVEFSIGTGFTQQDRYFLWQERIRLIGRTVTYKYQGGGGYEAPRFPSFKGFREDV